MVTKFHIKNLDCANCALKIENHLKSIPTVKSASVNFASSTLHIDTDEHISLIHAEVKKVEPQVILVPLSQNAFDEKGNEKSMKTELGILGIATVLFLIQLLFEETLHTIWTPLEYIISFTAYFLAGHKVLRSAWNTIRKGAIFDENVLMTIATAGAFGLHALSEAIGVMIFYKIGELLQEKAVSRSRKAVRTLLAIRPQVAHIKKDDSQIVDLSPELVEIGSILEVRPGERIPLDGTVKSGSSFIDTSPLTGESKPSRVIEGDIVLAGEINIASLITIQVDKPFSESSIVKILELVENAQSRKATTEKFISRIAKYYTPFVVLASLAVALLPPLLLNQSFHTWIYRALVLLVISCPCALVISIPIGFFCGIGAASRKGVLVKGAQFLEALSRITTIVFDKTGTLTQGVFKVKNITPAHNYTKEQLLEYAAIAEESSNHPIAQSIKDYYYLNHSKLPRASFYSHEEVPGAGVKVRYGMTSIILGNRRLFDNEHISYPNIISSDTTVYIAIDYTFAGYITIGDSLKESTPPAIDSLRKIGIKTMYMLTGDTVSNAAQMSQKLKLNGYFADLLPEQKVEKFEQIKNDQKMKGNTAFVGDGINDAPVIARADVGIAMGTLGSEAAIDSADVVITGDSPQKIVDAITIAKFTKGIIWQNIFLALGVKVLFLSLGSLGFATMWEAVFADMGTALVALLNSSRVLSKYKN